MTRKEETSSILKPSKWRKKIPFGILVWAKIANSPWWPGLVVSYDDCGLNPPKVSNEWIFWLGDHRVSEVPVSQLHPFAENFLKLFPKNNKGVKLNRGVFEAIKIQATRNGEMDSDLWNFTHAVSWISNLPDHLLKSKTDYDVPEFVSSKLIKIKLQNLEINQDRKRRNDDSDDEEIMSLNKKLKESLDKIDRSEEIALKCSVIDRILGNQLKIEDICLCCAHKKKNLCHDHPFFQGKACTECFDEMKDSVFSIGEDGVYFHCVVCANRGEVFICDNKFCRRVYCSVCIEVYCPKKAKMKIVEKNPWNCFLCTDYDRHLNGLLKKREDWSSHIAEMYIGSVKQEVIPNIEKRPLRVLSLFDGIGSGLCILNKLNLDLEVYYACEIDDDAINLTKMNHGTKVTHLGSIEALTDAELAKLCPIDLLIGGSPCNELSGVNHARKGIYNATGTGVLFFDFYRVLQFLKNNNKDRYLFWLFENVASMPKEYRKVITRFFECEPVVLNANHFTAQNRSRFFWGNVPSLKVAGQTAMNIENCPGLDSILTKNCERQAVVSKVGTVTSNPNSLKQGKEALMPVIMNGKGDTLWVTEIEELFGFPRHYTDSGNLSTSRRLGLLGKAWSIPVLCHILRPLTSFYSLSTNKIKK